MFVKHTLLLNIASLLLEVKNRKGERGREVGIELNMKNTREPLYKVILRINKKIDK